MDLVTATFFQWALGLALVALVICSGLLAAVLFRQPVRRSTWEK